MVGDDLDGHAHQLSRQAVGVFVLVEEACVFRAAGVFHTFVPNEKITRTFEMENVPFGIQLELTTFEKLTDDTSRINIRTIYETVAQRDQVVQFGMAKGIAMAHDRLVAVVSKLK